MKGDRVQASSTLLRNIFAIFFTHTASKRTPHYIGAPEPDYSVPKKTTIEKKQLTKLFLFPFLWKRKEKKIDAHTTYPYFGSHFLKFYLGK